MVWVCGRLGLVIHGWVENQVTDEFAGVRLDDPNVAAVDQHQDGGSGVGSADADVVQSAVMAEGEFAVGVSEGHVFAANSQD